MSLHKSLQCRWCVVGGRVLGQSIESFDDNRVLLDEVCAHVSLLHVVGNLHVVGRVRGSAGVHCECRSRWGCSVHVAITTLCQTRCVLG
jgi:hypothetical protein